jgi:hypothetical protein
MFKRFSALALACAVFMPLAALAQVVNHAADIAAAPWVAFLAPYLNAVVTAIIGVVVPALALKALSYFNIKGQDDAVTRLRQACQTYAGGLLAKAEDNLANKTFNVGSPEVALISDMIATNIPGVLARSGLDADAVARMALGEIGKIQALATTTIVSPPKDAAPVVPATPSMGPDNRAAAAYSPVQGGGGVLRSPAIIGMIAIIAVAAPAGCQYTAQQRADLQLTLSVAQQVGRDAVQFYCSNSGLIYVIASTVDAKARVTVALGKNAAVADAACPLILKPQIQVITQTQASAMAAGATLSR